MTLHFATSDFLIIFCSTYIVSTGKTRQNHSAIFFDTKERNSRIPSKRKRDQLTPIVLMEQIFESTLSWKEDNETIYSSLHSPSNARIKERKLTKSKLN